VLAALEKRYGPKGLRVLGFPCNDFANEEPDDLPTICAFMKRQFGATYRMYGKVRCVDPGMHPLYAWLTSQPPRPGKVGWNFAKFLIGRDGAFLGRWAPDTAPDARIVTSAIEKALMAPPPR
jgi:glutathione peroxidase